MANKSAMGVIHICGANTEGGIKLETSLLGKKISCLYGSGPKLIATTEHGAVDVITQEKVSDSRYMCMAFGDHHNMALTSNGTMYSWGFGEYGELGLGSKIIKSEDPTEIAIDHKIVDIACGEYHSCACDDKGNMYSWGQNFDRQLGLYKKTRTQMENAHVANCYIEDIILSPRFLPFSCEKRVVKVACGARFTAAITAAGDVWTWGAGECGQLGYGRCTKNEIPRCCYHVASEPASASAKSDTTDAIVGSSAVVKVVCGFAHIMALTVAGEVYAWGINKQGQLGLGDDATRQQPELLPVGFFKQAISTFQSSVDEEAGMDIILSESPDQFNIVQIYANLHSSAAVDSAGRLYTWGSGANYRTMHEHSKALKMPTLVHRLAKNEVTVFAFSDKASAALVLTKLNSVYPLNGPVKSFTNLTLNGCGFYPSDDIVVKFTRVGVAFVPPRSSLGTYVKDGVISCSPPNFSQEGEYEVALAVNGVNFAAQTLKINVYSEPSLFTITPQIVNTKDVLASQGGTISVLMTGVNLEASFRRDVSVKFTVTSPFGGSDAAETLHDVVKIGTLSRKAPDTANEEVYDEEEEDGGDSYAPSRFDSAGSTNNKDEPLVEYTVTCDFTLSELMGVAVDESNVSLVSRMVSAAVSLNDQDYCASVQDKILVHSFTPTEITPSCSPMDSASHISVVGSGFLPSDIIPTEALITVIGAKSFAGMAVALPVVYTSFMKSCGIKCNKSTELQLTLPKLQDILVDCLMDSSRAPAISAKGSVTSAVSAGSGNASASVGTAAAVSVTSSRPGTSEPPGSANTNKPTISTVQANAQVAKLLEGVGVMDIEVSFRIAPPTIVFDNEGEEGALATEVPPLSDVTFPMILYKSAPIKVHPAVFRRRITGMGAMAPPSSSSVTEAEAGGPDEGSMSVLLADEDAPPPVVELVSPNPAFVVQSGSLLFPTSDAKIAFIDPKLEHVLMEASLEARPPPGSRPATREAPPPTDSGHIAGTKPKITDLGGLFTATCPCPTMYMPPIQYDEDGLVIEPEEEALPTSPRDPMSHKVEFVDVALLLDGKNYPPNSFYIKVPVFDGVLPQTIEVVPQEHKGHLATGDPVSVKGYGIVPSTSCIVRLHGADEKKFVAIYGTVDENTRTVNFTLPEDIHDHHKVEGVAKGKTEKLFYVSISLDGGMFFDRSAEPILLVGK